jgi:hypothetical protein
MNPFEKFNSAPDALDIRQWMQQQKALQAQQAQQQSQPQKKGNFFTSLIPSGGGIAGAAGGAALGTAIAPGVGTLLGALLGGAVGGGAGKVAENAVEGQKNVFEGVPQEAAVNGVLGAGPLRLLKGGVDVARGLKAGTGLADAITNAGTKAVDQSITGAVGNKLTNASNDLVVKNFRLSPSQLSNFKTKFGEDASQVIKRNGLVGQDAAGIQQKAIQPLQNEFDSITQQIPSLPTADVLKAFKAKYEPLINSSVEDKQAIGQQLKQQADTIAKMHGAEIPSGDLANIRQEFDSLVNYADKAANPARYGVNKLSADAIRSTLQQAADKAGIKASNGMTFKDVGQELSKLHQLTDNIGKQEQLGRGSLPAGLTTLLGGGLGVPGGPIGVITGALGAKALNSNLGRRALASGTEKLGAKLTDKAASAQPFNLMSAAKRIAPIGVAQGLANQSLENNKDNNTSAQSTDMVTNMGKSYTNSSDMSSTTNGAQASPYSQANLLADVNRDPKNADKYISLYQQYQKIFASPTSKPLNATQLQQANNANSGLSDLQTIAQEIQQDPSVLIKEAIPGGGLARRLTGTNNYDAAKQNVVDVISRLRSGAAITQDEANRYMGLLPGATDTAQSATQKLQRLATLLSSFANPEAAQPDMSTSDLATILSQG